MGVSGDTTEDLLKRFTPECEARNRKSQIILFAIGINDSYDVNFENNPRVQIEQFQSNLHRLVKEAKKFSDMIAFIGLTTVDEAKMPRKEIKYWNNTSIGKYNEVIKEMCTELKIPFLDMIDVIDIKDLPDGLHPDAHGHEKMFQRIKEFLIANNIV